MANIPSDRAGIVTWVSAIRTTMANDPGRQLLEDQIQTSGFLFLEDYLDGILARPRHNPIIELAKTPARKKDASRRTRLATASTIKAKALELGDEDSDKENGLPTTGSAPVNAFHKALLQSKDSGSTRLKEQTDKDTLASANTSRPSKRLASKKKLVGRVKGVAISDSALEGTLMDEGDEVEKIAERTITSPYQRTPPPQSREPDVPELDSTAVRVDEPSARTEPEPIAELSIILEDDEPAERSQSSTSKPSREASAAANESPDRSSNKRVKNSKPYPKKSPQADTMADMDVDDFTQTTNFTVTSTSTQSFQTVPLDSPHPSAEIPTNDTSRPELPKPRPSTPYDGNYTTAPLPSEDTWAENAEQAKREEKDIARKPNVSDFPTIRPPSPLRKSLRAPKTPSLDAANAPPAGRIGTTRSSWLVKAREAKAMEDNAKRLAAIPAISHQPAPSAGLKRKSDHMHNIERDGIMVHEDTGPTQKQSKITQTSPVLTMLKEQDKHPFGRVRDDMVPIADENDPDTDGSDGMIDKLKKTVAGFSARAGRSMGKSLGGAAATALAEARAAAEAKIAERNAVEGRVVPADVVSTPHEDQPELDTSNVVLNPHDSQQAAHTRTSNEEERRLSVSELVSKHETAKNKQPERVFRPPSPEQPKKTRPAAGDIKASADTSTSTTPPNSPPRAREPVFKLPEKPKLPPLSTFFPPQTFTRFEAQSLAPSRAPQPLSSHSSLFSTQATYSDAIFDNGVPSWVPSTQDTDLSDHVPFQNTLAKSTNRDMTGPETDMDADESWHLDEKFGEIWTPVVIGMKDDSMTWSTAPTQSTRSGDSGVLDVSVPPPRVKSGSEQEHLDAKAAEFETIPSDNPPVTTTDEIDDEDMDVELDEDVASIRLVTPAARSNTSLFSTQSSKLQGQEDGQASTNNTGGFFSSATKLVSSVLGGSKKGKEPVKSIQRAAVAARKQQEEAERKANRLKEMEARRQQVLHKKADEDKAREEKKTKEDLEKRKREREKEKEDTIEKKTLRQPGKKLAHFEDELAKKRKIAESEKKAELKKPSSKEKKDGFASKIGKFAPTSSQSGPGTSVLPSKTMKQVTVPVTQSSTTKATKAPGETKSVPKGMEDASKHSSQVVQSQMQARYQAQLTDTRKSEMPPPANTESIELPDINSEYSDSDDENRVRTFDPPVWAQSPELREALQSQSTVDPDDIFGSIKPLKMEELFKNRTSRFRARTSSATWAGVDELTAYEERQYAKRMGYKK